MGAARLAVGDAHGVHGLFRREPQHPRCSGRRCEMTEEAAVDEAALDNPDPGCHAQTADEFETGNKTGAQARAGDRAPGEVGRAARGRYDREPRMPDRPARPGLAAAPPPHTRNGPPPGTRESAP